MAPRKALDEASALYLEALDDMAIVDDLVAHIDRRAISLERPFNDLDRAHHAGTEAAWLRQDDFHDPAPEPGCHP